MNSDYDRRNPLSPQPVPGEGMGMTGIVQHSGCPVQVQTVTSTRIGPDGQALVYSENTSGYSQAAVERWNEFFPSFQKEPGWRDVMKNIFSGMFPNYGNNDSYERERAYHAQVEHARSEMTKIQQINAQRDQDYQNLLGIVQGLKTDNEAFRAQIFSMGSGRGPLREENHYIHNFESLKTAIDQGVLKLSRANSAATTPPPEILATISKLGEHGERSAAYFSKSKYHTLPALYSQSQWRLAVIRHVVALFLIDRVFEPYVFGVSQEFSKGLKCIENDVLERGSTRCFHH